ncbi:hypothetical protein F4703DRAFT_1919310 [Phycomyces blakesleeanus]
MNPTVYQFQIPSYGVSYDNILAEIHLNSQHNCHTSPQFNTYNCQGLNSNQQEQTVCNQSSNLLYGYSPPLIPTQKATQTSSFFPDVNFELNNDEALCNTTSIQHILSINRVTLDKCPFCSYKVNIQKIYNQMSPSHPTNEKTLYHIMDQFNQHDCPAQAQYKAKHIIQSELCAYSTSKVVPSILKPQQFVFFNTFLESFTRKHPKRPRTRRTCNTSSQYDLNIGRNEINNVAIFNVIANRILQDTIDNIPLTGKNQTVPFVKMSFEVLTMSKDT